jgi:hypothetical protein
VEQSLKFVSLLPPGIDWDDHDISDPFWVAFRHDAGYMIGGQTVKGIARIAQTVPSDSYMVRASKVEAFIESRKAYQKLYDWIAENAFESSDQEKIRDMALAIGPDGSYFARCGTNWTSHDLPADLMKHMEEEKEKNVRIPAHVALGMGGSWIILWSSGSPSYNFRDHYDTLRETGKIQRRADEDNDPVTFLALDPYQDDKFFLVTKSGAFSYSTALVSSEHSKDISDITDAYMRNRAQRDGSEFIFPITRDGIKLNVRITKDEYSVKPVRLPVIQKLEYRMTRVWETRGVLMQRNSMVTIGAISTGAAACCKASGAPASMAIGVGATTAVLTSVGYLLGYTSILG